MGYQRVISGLSEGYKRVISELSESYKWVISGLSVGYFCFNDIFDFGRTGPSLHVNDKDKQVVSMEWTEKHPD